MKTPDHIAKSFKRTGKYYGEVHWWLDEKIKDGKRTGGRHSGTHSKEGLAYIQEKWGDEAYQEARQHILDDGIDI